MLLRWVEISVSPCLPSRWLEALHRTFRAEQSSPRTSAAHPLALRPEAGISRSRKETHKEGPGPTLRCHRAEPREQTERCTSTETRGGVWGHLNQGPLFNVLISFSRIHSPVLHQETELRCAVPTLWAATHKKPTNLHRTQECGGSNNIEEASKSPW